MKQARSATLKINISRRLFRDETKMQNPSPHRFKKKRCYEMGKQTEIIFATFRFRRRVAILETLQCLLLKEKPVSKTTGFFSFFCFAFENIKH
jgi:hypothetical protein